MKKQTAQEAYEDMRLAHREAMEAIEKVQKSTNEARKKLFELLDSFEPLIKLAKKHE